MKPKKAYIILTLLIMVAGVFSGCIINKFLYGKLIYEQEKEFSSYINFDFKLNQSKLKHQINININYKKTNRLSSGGFKAELKTPSGKTKTKKLTVSSSGDGSGYVSAEKALFGIKPEKGKYKLTITEDKNSDLTANKVTLKIYKKDK